MVIYIRPGFDGNEEILELCIGKDVYPLTDKQALAMVREIVKRLL